MTTAPEFGWRFSAAVAGVLSVLLTVRIARRMFGSTMFLVFAVVYVLGALASSVERRFEGAIAAGTYVVLVALCFAYFFPIFVAEPIPYADWLSRMWLGALWHTPGPG